MCSPSLTHSLYSTADPLRFKSLPEFIHKFGSLKDAQQVAQLHDMLRPYLLRRIKEDVEKSLPPKEETIIEVRADGWLKMDDGWMHRWMDGCFDVLIIIVI